MDMNPKIQTLFKTRDEAVAKNDKYLFLSTQLKEIDGSSSIGYLDTDHMTTTILHAHKHDHEPNVWIVFVREDYFTKSDLSHSNYLLYKITDIRGDFTVTDIRW